MSDKKIDLLDEQLRNVIDNFCAEWDISVASVVGTLEIIKSDCICRAQEEDEDPEIV